MTPENLPPELENTLDLIKPTPEEDEKLRVEEQQKLLQRRERKVSSFISRYIGNHYLCASFEGAEETQSLVELRDNLRPGRLAFIQGGTGCGKTYAAAAWIRREILEGRDVYYIRAVDFMNRVVKKAWAFMPTDSEDLLNTLQSVNSLVFDDVGTEDMTPDFLTQFSALLDFRYAHELTTIILTNLPFEYWQGRYGDRVVSRIEEWAAYNFLQTDDPDLRKQISYESPLVSDESSQRSEEG